MKVFISWSGNKSHKVAMCFREWLPSVIQSLEPYVSSEDIDKGARWSTDIAKELEDSSFGILCVTKDNLHAPWLSFEAGALSKTVEKTYVTPFLFDIKRSEVDGPILQFQSTIFEKEDIKKLVNTLNKACGENGITEAMLEKAFEVWYPTLQEELDVLKDEIDTDNSDKMPLVHDSTAIIEEILELSRDNQKLLRNPDTKISDGIDALKERLEIVINKYERAFELNRKRQLSKYKFSFQEELLHEIIPNCNSEYAFLITLTMVKDDYPWIYNMGKELIDELKSDMPIEIKSNLISDFRRMLTYTCEHPMLREITMQQKESFIFLRDIQFTLDRLLKNIEIKNLNSASVATRKKKLTL